MQGAARKQQSTDLRTINIVLADDHHVVRQGLRALLEGERDFRVVAEAADGVETTKAVDEQHPDVLIVDVRMPNLNGLEVARQVSERSPKVRIILISMHADEAYVFQALRYGADGYVLKNTTADELVKAVRQVYKGYKYLSEPFTHQAINAYAEKAQMSWQDPLGDLSTREREVFLLTAEGYTSAEIGERLSISPRTVETHRANVMSKLHLKNQADVGRLAASLNLLPARSSDG